MSLPRGLFRENVALETVDFSRNRIHWSRLELTHLPQLRRYDISRNRLVWLSDVSYEKLFRSGGDQLTLTLGPNPVRCSCRDMWLYQLDRKLDVRVTWPACSTPVTSTNVTLTGMSLGCYLDPEAEGCEQFDEVRDKMVNICSYIFIYICMYVYIFVFMSGI